MIPHNSPKMHPIELGMGNLCHSTSQSRITTKAVRRAPISDPKTDDKIVNEVDEDVRDLKSKSKSLRIS